MLAVITVPAFADNYIYLLHEPVAGKTAAVDPGEAQPVLNELASRGWSLDYIFNTHHHADHIGGNALLRQRTGCRIVASEFDSARIGHVDLVVKDGDIIMLGELPIQVIATPGHTLGHIVFFIADSPMLFSGDTLFSLGCGRLFEGSAEQMWASLQKLKALPDVTRIYCAHEYTAANVRFALTLEPDNIDLRDRAADVARCVRHRQPTLPSTLALELKTNPFLREDSSAIRAVLAMPYHAPQTVFAQLRSLKDRFIS